LQDQRVFILEHYFSTRPYAECQNAFRNSSPDSVVPNKSTIQRLVEFFRETGSIGEKRRSGRPSVLSNDSLEDIRARLLQSQKKIIKKTFPTNWNDLCIRTKGLLIVILPMGSVTFGPLCIRYNILSWSVLGSVFGHTGFCHLFAFHVIYTASWSHFVAGFFKMMKTVSACYNGKVSQASYDSELNLRQ
jgi:hypothetical protein